MKLRSKKKVVARVESRRRWFDMLMGEAPYRNYPQGAVTRPGSQNPKKGAGAPGRKKRTKK